MIMSMINPAFDSWQAFWRMGHHGPYVWAAWGASVLLILLLIWWMRWQRQHLLRQFQQQQRLRQRTAKDKPISNPVTAEATAAASPPDEAS